MYYKCGYEIKWLTFVSREKISSSFRCLEKRCIRWGSDICVIKSVNVVANNSNVVANNSNVVANNSNPISDISPIQYIAQRAPSKNVIK